MNSAPRPNFRNPVHVIAFGFGTGLTPMAPGTAGTALGVFIYLSLAPLPLPLYLAVTALFFVAGVWICGQTARDLGVHDHGGIVWDEIVGFLAAMTALPAHWTWMAAGFVVFRLLDIVKPWPIRWLDRRLGGGLGIMLDDLLAGALACLLLQLIYRLF